MARGGNHTHSDSRVFNFPFPAKLARQASDGLPSLSSTAHSSRPRGGPEGEVMHHASPKGHFNSSERN